MLRWLNPLKPAPEPPDLPHPITDDPLAIFVPQDQQIYSVSRSVLLPRVSLKILGDKVNPLFRSVEESQPKRPVRKCRGDKSNSSGYGGSHSSAQEQLYNEQTKTVAIIETKPAKSESGGTLNTIPEGQVDVAILQPIWPDDTSLNDVGNSSSIDDCSIRDILVDLLNGINETMEGKNDLTPEEMLKTVNEKISSSIEALKINTEEEMRKLSVNLSNCRKVNSVLRAFSSLSSSPEWIRPSISNDDIFYQTPSSSSGFSDPADDKVPNYYGTIQFPNSVTDRLVPSKKTSLQAGNDAKPSVWEQYYGVRADQQERNTKYVPKPTDVPLFPGGRPEADFTLDMPRSEMLSKRMQDDKKWRFRCRLLTSFLGLVFFLLSVMAVSLMLTRGKRMFGSMM